MSGTSVDAVDAVVTRYDQQRLTTLSCASIPLPGTLRQAIQSLQQPDGGDLERAASVSLQLAELYAEVTREALAAAHCSPADVTALGAHGQTVRHRPRDGFTIQLLNAARLAELSRIPVVHDFRSADIAAGGQGAPLVPAFHAHVFGSDRVARAIVNIGGIANISVLRPSGTAEAPRVLGHDTGPGNTLLDQWHELHQGGRFDRDGAWAAGGIANLQLLDRMLSEPYFGTPPPKSTGRDDFNLLWVRQHIDRLQGAAPIAPQDVQATLAELTAETIARDCRASLAEEIYLCGGGVFNHHLVSRIQARLAGRRITDTGALGIAPMAVEAAAFAWLAARRIDGQTGNLPAVTGASGPRVLGSITDPEGRLMAGRR